MLLIFSLFFLFIFSSFSSDQETCYQVPKFITFPHSEVTLQFKEIFQVFELPLSSGARCLDGSNFKFYFSRGFGSGADKFILNWEAYSFCGLDGFSTVESCYYRSKTKFGSSNGWGENGTYVILNEPLGSLSNSEEYNPDFFNWNKLRINYCDGSHQQGYLEEPIIFNGSELWFRGFNNTLATLQYVREHFKLFEASEVIISGESSGGQTLYTWIPFLTNYFPQKIRLLAIADSGLFLNIFNEKANCHLFGYLMQQLANVTKPTQTPLLNWCPYSEEEAWKCFLPEEIIPYIFIPLFLANSQVDSETIRTQMGIECGANGKCSRQEKARIQFERAAFLGIALTALRTKPSWGFWLRSCLEHAYQETWAWYGKNKIVNDLDGGEKVSLRTAIGYWYRGKKAHYVDMDEWDRNILCLG